jgi:hypothetical protein
MLTKQTLYLCLIICVIFPFDAQVAGRRQKMSRKEKLDHNWREQGPKMRSDMLRMAPQNAKWQAEHVTSFRQVGRPEWTRVGSTIRSRVMKHFSPLHRHAKRVQSFWLNIFKPMFPHFVAGIIFV